MLAFARPGLGANEFPVLVSEQGAPMTVDGTVLTRFLAEDGCLCSRDDDAPGIVDEPLPRVRRKLVPNFADVHGYQHRP